MWTNTYSIDHSRRFNSFNFKLNRKLNYEDINHSRRFNSFSCKLNRKLNQDKPQKQPLTLIWWIVTVSETVPCKIAWDTGPCVITGKLTRETGCKQKHNKHYPLSQNSGIYKWRTCIRLRLPIARPWLLIIELNLDLSLTLKSAKTAKL